ncbi:MAG: hypothetical protein GY862_27165 [Gammaproteobacteria bacterium]|nr:hypothetical protein [Gammaproteobacteria bacterium]MCP5013880.1 hypothetical protein [Ketobacter sp.]
MSEYKEREIDSKELCALYAKHVSAMTSEGLHSKSDIAGELAYRDAEIERLRSEVAELKQSLGLPDEITAEPADNYDDLRKQFNAIRSLANGKCRMASHWSRLVDKLTRDAMLNSNDALSSERETNAMLTDALEKAEAERDKIESALKKMISMYIIDDYIHGEDRENKIKDIFRRMMEESKS